MSVGARAAAAAALALLAAGGALSEGSPRPSPAREPSPAQGAAERAFVRAQQLQRAVLEALPSERRAAQLAAAAAFRAVRDAPDASAEWAARAALEAAELLLAARDPAAARDELVRATRAEVPALWRCRAWSQLGALERRAERWTEALAAFVRAARVDGAPAQLREEAACAAARAHFELGELDAGRRLLREVAEDSRNVFTRIRAYDAWAASYVRARDLEAAAGVLELCRAATRELAFEETPRGERVRHALERMRVIGALERAVAARRAAR
jgi:tetratricopeptide (TPR) repeat protein